MCIDDTQGRAKKKKNCLSRQTFIVLIQFSLSTVWLLLLFSLLNWSTHTMFATQWFIEKEWMKKTKNFSHFSVQYALVIDFQMNERFMLTRNNKRKQD